MGCINSLFPIFIRNTHILNQTIISLYSLIRNIIQQFDVCEITLEFVQNYLRENRFNLNSTQARLSLPIIQRIHSKLKNGERFRALSVDDSKIVNGHHRYICLHILILSIETIPWRCSPANKITPWNEVVIDTSDWDNPTWVVGEKMVRYDTIGANFR